MSLDRERLLHDVGKYIARTATNLPAEAPIPPPLAQLLLRDVYGRGEEPAMSETFDALVGASDDPALVACRERLAAIDALESQARAGEPQALSRVAALAREVSEALNAWARS